MSKEQNIATQENFGKAVNSGELFKFRDLMTSDVKDHDPAPDQGEGPEGFMSFFEKFRAAFPDLKVKVEQMVADEHNVAIAYTVTGTHKGHFHGISPTGKSIEARGMQIAQFEDGRISERWGSSDELGILKQIGATTIPTT